MISEQ